MKKIILVIFFLTVNTTQLFWKTINWIKDLNPANHTIVFLGILMLFLCSFVVIINEKGNRLLFNPIWIIFIIGIVTFLLTYLNSSLHFANPDLLDLLKAGINYSLAAVILYMIVNLFSKRKLTIFLENKPISKERIAEFNQKYFDPNNPWT